MSPPLPITQLKAIAKEACDAALQDSKKYDHTLTQSWNEAIIANILGDLIQQTTPSSSSDLEDAAPPFKYMVNSTIIQHTGPSPAGLKNDIEESAGSAGRRGMHSAAGAYWNNEKDGMWSYKYEGGEGRGMDVVVCVMWVGI
ncbi:hypothetical protein Vi05172_g4684 [Venturia inaequalis]|uniref:Dynein light chain n=1 Tax=Venturia inaequalis TaxID=5025 RepID=A0A8H3YQ95_VENIN|nr:hypothetical protein EG327_010723 [Venturia inaequalis]RDI85155.1 hypothetical protein Vi05172_g4684 [Venturia inaequalis]